MQAPTVAIGHRRSIRRTPTPPVDSTSIAAATARTASAASTVEVFVLLQNKNSIDSIHSDSFNYFPEPSGSGIYTAQSAVDNILNNLLYVTLQSSRHHPPPAFPVAFTSSTTEKLRISSMLLAISHIDSAQMR